MTEHEPEAHDGDDCYYEEFQEESFLSPGVTVVGYPWRL